MTNAQTYDFEEFREELIRRFFNTHSYFFSCFSKQLKNLSTLTKDIQEDDYFLIAQVLEFLKNSENPLGELKRLAEIERIHDFEHALDETIHKLRQPNLQTGEMKEEINLLAIDLVDALVEIIHEMATKKKLLEIITGETEESALPGESVKKEDNGIIIGEPHGDVDDLFTKEKELMLDEIQFDELENLDIQNSITAENEFDLAAFDSKNNETQENKPSQPETGEAEFSDDFMTVVPATFSDSLIEYDNASSHDEESAAVGDELSNRNRAEPVSALKAPFPITAIDEVTVSEKEAVAESKSDTAPSPNIENAGDLNFIDNQPHEPAGLKNGFIIEAEKSVAEIRRMAAQLQPDKNVQKLLKKLQLAFLDLRESAMIHGFEAVEELAQKSQKLMQQLKMPYRHLTSGNIRFISEVINCLAISLVEDLDESRQNRVRDIIKRIAEGRIVSEETNAAEFLQNDRQEELSKPVVEAPSPPVPKSHAQPQAMSDSRDTAAAENADDETLDGYGFEVDTDEQEPMIKLPGENDEELFKLIKEISEHSLNSRKAAEPPVKPAAESRASDPLTIRDDYLNGSALEANAEMISFHAEAELYYRVASEAIERLTVSPSDRLALENLELAGYSLKGLAKKMGMDGFANFPELVEELISKVLQLQLPCTEKPLGIIKQGFHLHKNAASVKDMESPEVKKIHREVLRFIQSLEDFTQPKVS